MEFGNTIRPIWLNDTRASSDRKRIVCFGDSFIMANNAIVGGVHLLNKPFKYESDYTRLSEDYRSNPELAGRHQGNVIVFDETHRFFEKYTENWMTKTAMKLDYDFLSYGLGGSGTYHAYYSMLDYLKFQNHRRGVVNPPDVIIFVMGSCHRIWNKDIPNVCPGSLINAMEAMEAGEFQGTDKERHIWNALSVYFADLFDGNHEIQHKIHLMHYLDTQIVPQYPETKFVILHAFPDMHTHAKDDNDPNDFAYYYDFKNCMEIRPPLMYFSKMDQMPDDLKNEARANHFSPVIHEKFSDYMSQQIINFATGNHYLDIDLEKN